MAKPLVTIAFVINIVGAVIFATLWMKNIKRQLEIPPYEIGKYDWIISEIKTFHRDIFNLKSIQQIGAFLSIFLFVHFIGKSLSEFLLEFSPLKFVKLTKCISNIVQSTLLYSMILGFILMPMFITNYQINQQNINSANDQNQTPQKASKYGDELFMQILETFFYGRILFSVGYIFGAITTLQSFRAYGLALTMASITIALSQVYNFNIWAYF